MKIIDLHQNNSDFQPENNPQGINYSLGFDFKYGPDGDSRVIEVNGFHSGIQGLLQIDPGVRSKRGEARRKSPSFLFDFAVNRFGEVLTDLAAKDLTVTDYREEIQKRIGKTWKGESLPGKEVDQKEFLKMVLKIYRKRFAFKDKMEWCANLLNTLAKGGYSFLGEPSLQMWETEKDNFLKHFQPTARKVLAEILAAAIADDGFLKCNYGVGRLRICHDPLLGYLLYADQFKNLTNLTEWTELMQFIFEIITEAGPQKDVVFVPLSFGIPWHQGNKIFIHEHQFLVRDDKNEKAHILRRVAPKSLMAEQLSQDKLAQKWLIPEKYLVRSYVFNPETSSIEVFETLKKMRAEGIKKVVVKQAKGSMQGQDVKIFPIEEAEEILLWIFKYLEGRKKEVLVEEFFESKQIDDDGRPADGCMRYLVDISIDLRTKTYQTLFESGYWRLAPEGSELANLSNGAKPKSATSEELAEASKIAHQIIEIYFQNRCFEAEDGLDQEQQNYFNLQTKLFHEELWSNSLIMKAVRMMLWGRSKNPEQGAAELAKIISLLEKAASREIK